MAGELDPILAGRVGRPHGLDGSFHVVTPFPTLLVPGAPVSLGGRETTIERRAGTDAKPIVRVGLAGRRDEAELLRGGELMIAPAHAPELGKEEWYSHQLEGCEVVDGDRPVGVVGALRCLPSCEVLEVQRTGGGELLVPLVRDAVRSVDVDGRRIDIDLGFLEGG